MRAFGEGRKDTGRVGAGLEYAHRITADLLAVAEARGGYAWEPGDRGAWWEALAGARWTF